MRIYIAIISFYLFTLCKTSDTIEGAFKICEKNIEIKLNSFRNSKKISQDRTDLFALQNNKTQDYFYTFFYNNRISIIYYVDDGKIYNTKCKNNVNQITFHAENQKSDEEEECQSFVWIKYSGNNEGFLNTEGIIREKTKLAKCSDIIDQKFYDTKGEYIFTRNRNKITFDKEKGIFKMNL